MGNAILIIAVNVAFWLAVFYGPGAVIVALPESFQRWAFNHRRRFYRVSEREMKFYRKIRLPMWKDYLPQHNTDFDKRHLPRNFDMEYLRRYIFVTCRSEVIHYVIGIVGFLSVTLSRLSEDVELWRDIYTLMASLDAIGNMPFAMIQRYNRYRLERLASRMQQKC